MRVNILAPRGDQVTKDPRWAGDLSSMGAFSGGMKVAGLHKSRAAGLIWRYIRVVRTERAIARAGSGEDEKLIAVIVWVGRWQEL